mmetsp:Transcript_69383/g.225313  ORF Transcript_69383/g.225313 Transcript_69383/m.225313 type:complete len:233 (+) Transcript_69383:221-919(+)
MSGRCFCKKMSSGTLLSALMKLFERGSNAASKSLLLPLLKKAALFGDAFFGDAFFGDTRLGDRERSLLADADIPPFLGFGSSLLSVGFGSSLCFGAFFSSFFKSFGSFGCAKASAVAGTAFFFFSFLPSFSAFCPSGPATGQLFPRFCNISCIFFASATGVADIGAGAGAATTAAAGVATGSGSAAAAANDSISGASSFDASAFVVFTSTVFFVEAFAESSTSSSTMPTFAT